MPSIKELRRGGSTEQNQGSGAGYLLGKVGEGFTGWLEGTSDFLGSGLAKLLGDKDLAEYYYRTTSFGNQQGTADYNFNPSSNWKFAGDIASGIGNSIPGMALAFATGGASKAIGLSEAAANVFGGITTFTSSFLSAAGSGVKEAYEKTGVLDNKAWESGIASGVIEGATETFSDYLLGGVNKGALNLGRTIVGNTAATTVKKVTTQIGSKVGVQAAKQLAGSFFSEALEEGISAVLNPIANNIIYRQEIASGKIDKETIDWQDVLYQMVVGGMSGAIMGGATIAINSAVNTARGNNIVKRGSDAQIISNAQNILSAFADDSTLTNTDAYKYLQQTLNNYEKAKTGVMQARYMQELNIATANVVLSSQVVQSAQSILANPKLTAEKINEFGLKDETGKTITVTAEDIVNSVKDGNLGKSLSDNTILTKLAILDAAGKLLVDTQAYESAVQEGRYLGSRVDVANFLQNASQEEINAVNSTFGFDISKASYEDISNAFTKRRLNQRFGDSSTKQNAQTTSQTAEMGQVPAGAQVLGDTQAQSNMRQQSISKAKTNAETNEETDAKVQTESISETIEENRKNTQNSESILSENVKQWDELSKPNRILVRQIYESALKNDYTESEAITFARLSAKSGIGIEFSDNFKESNGKTTNGYYDPQQNVIVINTNSKKAIHSVLIHELTHSLETSKKYGKLIRQTVKNTTENNAQEIIDNYSEQIKNKTDIEAINLIKTEAVAHYSEKVLYTDNFLKNKKILETLIEEDGSIKDKILNFFKRNWGDSTLDSDSHKYLKAFKKAFDDISDRNFGMNAVSASYSVENFGNPEYSLSTWKKQTILAPDGTTKSGREILSETLKNAGKTDAEIQSLLKQVDSVANIVSELSEEFKSIKDFTEIVPYYRPKLDGSGYEPMLSCVISNGEYELNIDFTTICKKRESLSRFITEYQEEGRSFGKGFNQEAQAFLNNLLKKYDLETACTFCFVESRRANVDTWSTKFVTLWNQALSDSGIKNATPISSVKDVGKIDIISGITNEIAFDVANMIEPYVAEEMEAGAIQAYDRIYNARRSDPNKRVAPNTEERMREYIKNHAKDGKIWSFDKSDLLNVRTIAYISSVAPDLFGIFKTSYGTNAPKMTLPAAPYAADLHYNANFKNKKNKTVAQRAFEVGGVRVNSFSDFQISRILDYVQLVADAEALGLPIQTYVKELAMPEILGKSGIKGNMSLIPEIDTTVSKENAGLDKNGNFIFSSDSIDFKRAVELQDQEGIKGNWGTVLVGISKNQIITALNDPRIKMIIPYHRSGMPKALHSFYNHRFYTDYTAYQSTMVYADGKLKKASSDPFLDVFYKSYNENGGNYLQATQDYIQYCKDNGLIPRFTLKWDAKKSFDENINSSENYITNNPNYYKVLIDFTSDGGVDANGNQIFVPQQAVKLDLDGINIESIVRREATLLENEIKKYTDNKGAMFDAFEKAVEGKKINLAEQKAIRDARVAEENKQNIFSPINDRRYSISKSSSDENTKTRKSINIEIAKKAKKFGDWRKGTFESSTQIKGQDAIKILGKLSEITTDGVVNVKETRDVMRELAKWYKENREKLLGLYNQNVYDMMSEIAENQLSEESVLSKAELQYIDTILLHFKKVVEDYNRTWVGERFVDVTNEAKTETAILRNAKSRYRNNKATRAIRSYVENFEMPLSVARNMDGYQNGFFTQNIRDMSDGMVRSDVTRMNIRRDIEAFYQKHREENKIGKKDYLKQAEKRTANYNGKKLTIREAMYLYMLLNRKDAQSSILYRGFTVERSEGNTIRVKGVLNSTEFMLISDAEIEAKAKALADGLKSQFTKTDLEFISIAEAAFKETRKLKKAADNDKFGFSNVLKGYYVPKMDAYIAKSVDSERFGEAMLTVNEGMESFNIRTIENSNELLIRPLDQILETHIKGVCDYYALHRAFDAFDSVFNADIREDKANITSIRTEVQNYWDNAYTYFKKLHDDILGKGKKIDGFNAAVSFMRGGYAMAALGANPKVWLTQFSSIFASMSIIDFKSLVRSSTMKADWNELYKYCPIAEVRNLENTAFKASSIIDNVRGAGEVLMAPISKLDSLVISRLWCAAQAQVEQDNGLAIGTEANKKAAGKLLKRVIIETQQNANATERSAAMRSDSEFVRSIVMFKADSTQVLNRVIDSVGTVLSLKARIKQIRSGNVANERNILEAKIRQEAEYEASKTTDNQVDIKEAGKDAVEAKLDQQMEQLLPQLEQELETAKKTMGKSIGALLTTSLYMAFVGLIFRKLYRKKNEPEDTVFDFLVNLVTGLPIFNEIATFALQGYDLSSPSFEVVNDMFNTTKSIFNAVGSGDGEKILNASKNLLISAGQVLGLPVRNAINIYRAFRYEIEDIINGEPFSFNAGVPRKTADKAEIAYDYYQKGNDKLKDHYLEQISKEESSQKRAMYNYITDLFKKGKIDRSKAISQMQDFGASEADANWELDKDNYKDENGEYTISKSQYQKYMLISNSGINENVFYDFAKAVGAMESDKDKNGNTVAGSLRKKVVDHIKKMKISTDQKILLLALQGYTLKDGDFAGLTKEQAERKLLAYVKKLAQGKSAEEKERLAKAFGFVYKNGTIKAA